MRLHSLVLAGAIAAVASIAAQEAAAVPVAGVVYEGGGPGVHPDAPIGGVPLGDFSTDTSDPTLEVMGDTQLYGGVVHQTTSQYVDGWSMDFGSASYEVVFNWQPTTDLFDGRLIVSTLVGDIFLDAAGGTASLGILTGLVTFVVDPVFGTVGTGEATHWDLQATAVPLPAGAVLFLSGLGGLVLLRNRKNA